MVASKSKYTVKGTSPKYLKLSWKEIISPLSKQEVMPSLALQTLVCFSCFHNFLQRFFHNMGIVLQLVSYFFLSFNIFSQVPSIGKVNLVGAVARYRNIFIINRLVDNINRRKFYLFFMSELMFCYLITIKFLYN